MRVDKEIYQSDGARCLAATVGGVDPRECRNWKQGDRERSEERLLL